MSAASVLYDAPGPKALRRQRVISVVSAVVFLALAVLVVVRLYRQGQFEADLWAPLLFPTDDQFVQVWTRILTGLLFTLMSAALAIVFSLVLGTAITTVRLMLGRTGRLPVIALVELLRGAPVVILIFFSARFLPQVGLELSQLWYLVIGLTLYNFVVIAEILRAGVSALPKGQREAGMAIGMSRSQVVLLIQMPQAFRLMLPALISQLVVIVKDTSLAGLVLTGPQELLNVGKSLVNFFGNPLQVYTIIAAIYIALNSALSALAVFVERKLGQARRADAVEESEPDEPAVTDQNEGAAPRR